MPTVRVAHRTILSAGLPAIGSSGSCALRSGRKRRDNPQNRTWQVTGGDHDVIRRQIVRRGVAESGSRALRVYLDSFILYRNKT